MAVKAVASGSKTPGMDNIIWKTPTQKANAVDKLLYTKAED